MMRAVCGSLALGIAFALAAPAAQDRSQLETTLQALKAKRHAPGVQTYKIKFEKTTLASKEVRCGGTEEITIEWPQGRMREDGWTTCVNPHEQLAAFDGETMRTKSRRLDPEGKPSGDWKYGMTTGTHRARFFVADYWAMFFHRGVIISSSSHAFYPGHFAFDVPDENFFLHRKGSSSTPQVIRSFPEGSGEQNFYEFTIDPTKNYAVTHFAQFVSGVKTSALTSDVERRDGTWALTGWQLLRFSRGKHSHTIKATILSFSETATASPGLFDLAPPEGARVGRGHFELPAGSDNYKIQRYEYEVRDGELVQVSGPTGGGWFRRNWVWVACLVVLVLVAVVARVRRAPGRRPDSPTGPPA